MDLTSSILFLLALSAALAVAWLAGYRSRFRKFPGLKRSPDQDYFIGLNYLLNDEPDDAIDIFIDALEQNPDTLETHLALCTLLRRRGKVDRAIAHCQHLLANQNFGVREISQIKINLVRSFLAAGLLDRAERLLDDLKRGPPAVKEAALVLAITVYQMEKEWEQALAAATELLRICPVAKRADLQLQTSHFHCELAETALNQQDSAAAREHLKKAGAITRSNVRIYLLLGKIEALKGDFREAVKALEKVQQYDGDFAGEACSSLLEYMQKAGQERQLVKLLEEVPRMEPGSRQLLALAEVVKSREGDDAALRLLQQQLQSHPSLAVLAQTLAYAVTRNPEQGSVLRQGAQVLELHLQNCAQYRCDNCGFDLKHLHWLCPGCSRWGTVKPLEDKIVSP
jgi:lipopolysaccharide biosynthesis regulator YciM